ncbi:hypothetical protein DSECCO2_307030 [anaerobic digester metagenome]
MVPLPEVVQKTDWYPDAVPFTITFSPSQIRRSGPASAAGEGTRTRTISSLTFEHGLFA